MSDCSTTQNFTILRNYQLHVWLVTALTAIFCLPALHAQISEGGAPPSFQYEMNRFQVPVIQVSPPDVGRLLAEDGYFEKDATAPRFAESAPVMIDLSKDGKWERLPDGSRICRLTISSENAQALLLYYRQFVIPEGGRLFLYDETHRQVIGAFTSRTNPLRSAFATEMIRGGSVTLEYHEAAGIRRLPEVIINEVGYVYRTADRFFRSPGFGKSDTCEVNVNCPEGDNWQDQKNGVARIIVKSGFSSLWCTGSLINNTRMDFSPLFLTADHCGATATPENYNQWIFYFRYEGPDCDNPTGDSAFISYSMVGATKLAASGGAGLASDFKLLRLNQTVPQSYKPYFNGWSILNEASASGVTIHHPEGDIKKISTYTDSLQTASWSNNFPNTHWRVFWSATETNWGVTEPGSSGSPIFDEQGRLIGQLTGGQASCSRLTSPDYYGKISYSWDGNPASDTTMLRPWLDPENTGATTLNGIVNITEPSTLNESLRIYPNPTSGLLYIADRRLKGNDVEVEIYDLVGIMVLKQTFSGKNSGELALDLSHLKQGLYLISVLINGERFTAKVLR